MKKAVVASFGYYLEITRIVIQLIVIHLKLYSVFAIVVCDKIRLHK
jgi:hypothetical protein